MTLTNPEETVTITKSYLISLRIAAAELSRLDAAGVDNWSGCEYAYGEELFGESFEEECLKIKSEVEAM